VASNPRGGPAPPDHSDLDALEDLDAMIEEVAEAGGVLAPSAFWRDFAARNVATLRAEGLGAFKRSINHNYFQFVVNTPSQPEFKAVLRPWLRRPSGMPWRARLIDDDVIWLRGERVGEAPQYRRARGYAVYVALLWELARRRAGRGVADRLDEPAVGRPIGVVYRGKMISQDLANGLLELSTVGEAMPLQRMAAATVLELGGGYGRLSDLYLRIHPRARIVMVDIPPALAVSQDYLTRRHPELPVWRFRRNASRADLQRAVAEQALVFLTPNQFAALDPIGADLALNVSSLHEMLPEQIAEYLRLIGVHASEGWFYTKQWQTSHNAPDDVVIEHSDYVYPPGSRLLIDRTAPAQPKFFESLLRLP
jgi:putative sugar O-methyltransferase